MSTCINASDRRRQGMLDPRLGPKLRVVFREKLPCANRRSCGFFTQCGAWFARAPRHACARRKLHNSRDSRKALGARRPNPDTIPPHYHLKTRSQLQWLLHSRTKVQHRSTEDKVRDHPSGANIKRLILHASRHDCGFFPKCNEWFAQTPRHAHARRKLHRPRGSQEALDAWHPSPAQIMPHYQQVVPKRPQASTA